jgi:hypothetical protein
MRGQLLVRTSLSAKPHCGLAEGPKFLFSVLKRSRQSALPLLEYKARLFINGFSYSENRGGNGVKFVNAFLVVHLNLRTDEAAEHPEVGEIM